ncbi:sulfurtransferase [Bdellovibrio sp. HCB290]|uniref:sulfurtransferase n=1 Tax=Bdellovibrio sp. HCB290 TaxID=3394356 RepID=UPI0039B3B68D
MKLVISALVMVLALVACQTKPTKVTSEQGVIGAPEKLMDGGPVILDVRAPFEFNLAHVPGAINIRWEDFSSQDPNSRGVLQDDLFAVARRLSLIGIDPDSKVVILGKGKLGAGEEGRIAWTLEVLGVKNVHTALHTVAREMNPKGDEPPVKNKSMWKPVVDESLFIDSKNFKAYATQKLPPLKMTGKKKSKKAMDLPVSSLFGMNFNEAKLKVVILDVRSSAEYGINNLTKYKNVKAPVVQLEWKEFFTDSNTVAKDLAKKLESKGITQDKIIMVISSHGVRSGAVTFALREMGFRQSVNFAGGYEQWK